MPIYEYRCADGHEFEVVQRMTDDPVKECEACGKPVERVFSPVAVHYKGSGFYTTDYARKGKSGGGEGAKSETKPEGSASSGGGDSGSSGSDKPAKPKAGAKD